MSCLFYQVVQHQIKIQVQMNLKTVILDNRVAKFKCSIYMLVMFLLTMTEQVLSYKDSRREHILEPKNCSLQSRLCLEPWIPQVGLPVSTMTWSH